MDKLLRVLLLPSAVIGQKRWPDQDAMRNLDENGVQQSPGWSREAWNS